jgi:hypothetical protein
MGILIPGVHNSRHLWLTQPGRVLEKLIDAQLFNTFLAFYETQVLITTFT